MRWFKLDLNPEPWAIGSVTIGRRAGKLSGNVGRNQQLFNYQEGVRALLRLEAPEKLEGPIELEFYFWRQTPAYKSTDDRLVRKHDADYTNLVKGTEDALQSILFDNDRQVVGTGGGRIVAQGPDVEPLVLVGYRKAEHFGLEDLPDEAYDLLQPPGDELPLEDDAMAWNGSQESPF